MSAKFYPGQPTADYLAKLNELASVSEITGVTENMEAASASASTAATKEALASASASSAAGSASASAASAANSQAAAAAADVSKAAAAAAAASASASWTAALAANPDLNPVVRMHTNQVSADLAIPESYNASSIGPLTIAQGVTVTLETTSVWSIQ